MSVWPRIKIVVSYEGCPSFGTVRHRCKLLDCAYGDICDIHNNMIFIYETQGIMLTKIYENLLLLRTHTVGIPTRYRKCESTDNHTIDCGTDNHTMVDCGTGNHTMVDCGTGKITRKWPMRQYICTDFDTFENMDE